jgi:zinc protease
MSASSPFVLLERDASLPLIHAGISTRSGADEDPQGLEGLTRIAGRLMRRTAGGKHPDEIDARVDRMGASLGLDAGHGGVALSGVVLERSFADFMSLLEETLTAPGLALDELERLKRETSAELIEILDSDQQLAQRWFLRSVFEGHPYGRTVIGTERSLAAIGVEDVRRCLAREFRRDSLVFAFAGAVDAERAQRAAGAIWQRLPDGGSVPPPPAEPVAAGGRRLVFVDKPERTQTQILIGGIGSHPRDADHFALLLANTVFGGTFTARLTQEVRAKRGWSYGAYSSLGYDRQRQAFSMWTFPKAEDAARCIELELEMLQQWWESGITEEEFVWAQRYLVQSQAFARDTATKRIGLRLDEMLNDLPDGYHDGFVGRVQAVTLEQANTAVRNRISLEHLVVVVLGTHSAIGTEVKKAIPNLASERIVPFDAE